MKDIRTWLKAKFFLLSVLFIWLSLILQLLPLQIIMLIVCSFKGDGVWKDWNYSIWMIQDQFVNVILSGQHETTVSSSIGYMSLESRTAQKMRVIVDFLFKIFAGQEDHCRSAMEDGDVHRYSAIRAFIGLVGYVSSYVCFIFMSIFLIGLF